MDVVTRKRLREMLSTMARATAVARARERYFAPAAGPGRASTALRGAPR